MSDFEAELLRKHQCHCPRLVAAGTLLAGEARATESLGGGTELSGRCWDQKGGTRLSQAGPPAQSPVHSEQRTPPVPFTARGKVPREGGEYPALHGLSRGGVARFGWKQRKNWLVVNVEGDNLGDRAGPFPGHEGQDRCIHQAREGTEELDVPMPSVTLADPGCSYPAGVSSGDGSCQLLAVGCGLRHSYRQGAHPWSY